MSADAQDAATVNREQLRAADTPAFHVDVRTRLRGARGELTEAEAQAQLDRLREGLAGLRELNAWLLDDVVADVGAKVKLLFVRDELAAAAQSADEAAAYGTANGLLL